MKPMDFVPVLGYGRMHTELDVSLDWASALENLWIYFLAGLVFAYIGSAVSLFIVVYALHPLEYLIMRRFGDRFKTLGWGEIKRMQPKDARRTLFVVAWNGVVMYWLGVLVYRLLFVG